jgi:hypothetical protein
MSNPLRVQMSGPLSAFAGGFLEDLISPRVSARDGGEAAAVDGASERVAGRTRS